MPKINSISPPLVIHALYYYYYANGSTPVIAVVAFSKAATIWSFKARMAPTTRTQMIASKRAYSLASKPLSSLMNLFSIFFILISPNQMLISTSFPHANGYDRKHVYNTFYIVLFRHNVKRILPIRILLLKSTFFNKHPHVAFNLAPCYLLNRKQHSCNHPCDLSTIHPWMFSLFYQIRVAPARKKWKKSYFFLIPVTNRCFIGYKIPLSAVKTGILPHRALNRSPKFAPKLPA